MDNVICNCNGDVSHKATPHANDLLLVDLRRNAQETSFDHKGACASFCSRSRKSFKTIVLFCLKWLRQFIGFKASSWLSDVDEKFLGTVTMYDDRDQAKEGKVLKEIYSLRTKGEF